MGCTQTKKPDTRVEKTLARLSEKEKQLDMLIQQHQELIQKYDTNSLQATQKIPNGSTNEIKQNGSAPQTKEQNILPNNILDREDLQINSKKNLQESNQINEQRNLRSDKTLEKLNQDIYNNKSISSHQKTNEMNIAIANNQTGSQNGQQVIQQNIISQLDDNHLTVKQGSQQQKQPQGINQQQQIHVIQSEQVYNSNNIIRITEDNEDFTLQTDKKQAGIQSKHPHSVIKTQPTQRLSRGGEAIDAERKHTEDEVQQWANLIQAFDDVSIRPIDNFQDKEQPLSTDQIELDLGSQQKTSKSNGLPMSSPPPFIKNVYNTLPANGQNLEIQVNNNSEQMQRPKTMQTNHFDHLIHHPDIMKVYERVQKKILVKNDQQ